MAELPRGGIHAALLTPLEASGEVDTSALTRLVDILVDAGCDGVCPVGSAGEGPLLGPQRRAHVIQVVCEHVAGRLPVIPTVSHTDLPSAMTEIERFASLGATAVLVTAPPFYALGPAALIGYFAALADAAPLPLLLYDVPAFAGVGIGADTISDLATHHNIVGVKDSAGDEANLQSVLERTAATEFDVYCGNEPLLATAARLGAAGVIGASVNIAPELVRNVWHTAQGGQPGADALQAKLTTLAQACRSLGRPFGWKAAASVLGRCQPYYCPPITPPATNALNELERLVASLALVTVELPKESR